MPRYAVILTITYKGSVRTREGVITGKTYHQVTMRLSRLAMWQAEVDAETQGAPEIITLRIRELTAKKQHS